jgi:hypothetical protein
MCGISKHEAISLTVLVFRGCSRNPVGRFAVLVMVVALCMGDLRRWEVWEFIVIISIGIIINIITSIVIILTLIIII